MMLRFVLFAAVLAATTGSDSYGLYVASAGVRAERFGETSVSPAAHVHPARFGETTAQTTEPRVIRIAAERFTFTPSRITLEEGTLVEFRITSDDTSHGFHLNGPDNEINVEIPKRGRGDVRVRFLASQVGKYTFDCSQICGAGHDFMRGSIEVKPRRSPSGGGR